MENVKKLLKRVLYPHIAITMFLVPISASLLIYSFVFAKPEHPINYFSYALSAYSLTVLCLKTPYLIRFFKTVREENRYVNRLMTDPQLQVKLSLYGSLIVNVAYGIFQLGLGFYHASVWFYALAAYYFLLTLMRYFLLRDVRSFAAGQDLVSEYRRYRFCGIILLVMNLALALIVFFISWWNRGFEHHMITTIAMAAYTFTALTVAIVNVVRYRKYNSPVMSASKAISLAAAAVSMLTLENAMLNVFGDASDEAMRGIMTAATGIAVCVLVLIMAIYMIVHATKELKKEDR